MSREGNAWSLRPYWQPDPTPAGSSSSGRPLSFELLVESVSGPNRLRSRQSGVIPTEAYAQSGAIGPLTSMRVQADPDTRYRATLTLLDGERVLSRRDTDF